ncbi:hypothetical protein AUJ77_01225 [Candidatus Nomurabacteria bacterium CG1_02_43_90]|uniref:General secretion pathway GspH domain-containing protein n=1 Tax=Candidatus Nomurabacteria bacterium CG1_02_43_90 TaxID=1805281 RepID=A0A1J4V4M9_9BACT|nr:MAG: hypothetical protein AUJ77_01225 [Candidatus Nomurabacteria bacterium CG1_02_43_90]
MHHQGKKIKNTALSFSSRGFSALEILVVMGILAVLLSSIIPSFLNFRRNTILNTETQELMTIINRARLLSVSSKNDQPFGVHLESGKAVLFEGVTYSAVSATNDAHVFDPSLTLVFAVGGGGAEVLFQKVTGATNQDATTTLLVTGTTGSTTIHVFPTGIASIQ